MIKKCLYNLYCNEKKTLKLRNSKRRTRCLKNNKRRTQTKIIGGATSTTIKYHINIYKNIISKLSKINFFIDKKDYKNKFAIDLFILLKDTILDITKLYLLQFYRINYEDKIEKHKKNIENIINNKNKFLSEIKIDEITKEMNIDSNKKELNNLKSININLIIKNQYIYYNNIYGFPKQ